jgi:hypothetical protein
MFHTIQCSMSSVPWPTAASTSCAIKTKCVVPSGTLLHESGGDTESPACVYFAGIVPPSLHAVVESVIVWIGPRRFWKLPPPPPLAAPPPAAADSAVPYSAHAASSSTRRSACAGLHRIQVFTGLI